MGRPLLDKFLVSKSNYLFCHIFMVHNLSLLAYQAYQTDWPAYYSAIYGQHLEVAYLPVSFQAISNIYF